MKDHQLKALIQVAECGSIRAAARAMNLSQSALTKALRELEEDVGAELLTRSYKGIDFTPAGNALLVRARLAHATLDKAREEIRLLRGGSGARIAIALTPLVAATVLPPILTEFRQVQPDAFLSLEEGLLNHALPGLLEGRLDFAIALVNPQDLPYEVFFEPLAEAYAAPTGPYRPPTGRRSNMGATAGRELGAQSRPTAAWAITCVCWLTASGLQAPKNIVHCSSLTLMLELMRRTDHIGFGPTALLSDSLFGAGLQQLSATPLPPPMSLGILSLRGIPLSSSARMLAGLFARRLRKSGT